MFKNKAGELHFRRRDFLKTSVLAGMPFRLWTVRNASGTVCA